MKTRTLKRFTAMVQPNAECTRILVCTVANGSHCPCHRVPYSPINYMSLAKEGNIASRHWVFLGNAILGLLSTEIVTNVLALNIVSLNYRQWPRGNVLVTL